MEVFKEIMVELIKNREIDLDALQKERSQFIQDKPEELQLNDMLLTLAEGDGSLGGDQETGSVPHRLRGSGGFCRSEGGGWNEKADLLF